MKKRIKIEEINGVIYIDGVDILKLISDFSKENDRLKLENDNLKKKVGKINEKRRNSKSIE